MRRWDFDRIISLLHEVRGNVGEILEGLESGGTEAIDVKAVLDRVAHEYRTLGQIKTLLVRERTKRA